MARPYEHELIYLASPSPPAKPTSPPGKPLLTYRPLLPRRPAETASSTVGHVRHATSRPFPYAPILVPATLPLLVYAYPPPAYYALPYSYAFRTPAVPCSTVMYPYVPLISRIQLDGPPAAPTSNLRAGQSRNGGRSREERADEAGARVAARAESGQYGGRAPRSGRRSVSPRRGRTTLRAAAEDSCGRPRSTVPLIDRLSSRERPRASIPLADRFTDPPASTNKARGRLTLEERLASPATSSEQSRAPSPSPPPSPLATPAVPASTAAAPLDRVPMTAFRLSRPDRDVNALRAIPGPTRALRDDNGRICYTTVPVRQDGELFWYLTVPFEDDTGIAALRLPWEKDDGPAPIVVPARLRLVPPGSVLLHHHWGPFCLALWKRYGPVHVTALMRQEEWDALLESRTLAEWADALRPGSNARRTLGPDPGEWTEDTLLRVGLVPASDEESEAFSWENDTFLFRRDFEQLAARLHEGLRNAPSHLRGTVWARARDSIRRMWGPELTYFPDVEEAAFLDSKDDLVCMRHWRAMARLVLQWDLPAQVRERVHLATGGPVRRLHQDLQEILDELARRELGREMHVFPWRR
ncbi:hypothetical protein FOMPIDRAFT_1052296 [Fomitopsis schrenkii]|uniref:Uncharacterized protein n=1 Tax=Fomitopsis schrenkii TaxID=2126942 RepID=S8DWM0_FOMSC|nr:hypothetical protein FOMPIDRAFT_1052296 [Fomitopsis schrenkii]